MNDIIWYHYGKWIADFDSSLNRDYYGMPDDRIDYRIIY